MKEKTYSFRRYQGKKKLYLPHTPSLNTLGIQKTIPLLGGSVEFSLYTSIQPLTDYVFNDISTEALRLQKIFNFFDPTSELSLLNQKRKMTVSKELEDVVQMCLPYCAGTNGAYDISKGKQIIQRKKNIPITPIKCSYKDIYMENNTISLTHEDVLMDLGSVAKGYMGDKLKAFLMHKGITGACINLRGDLIFWGDFTETINIQHPRDTEKPIFSFPSSNAAIATSGDYNQYYGSYENSHILNAQDLCSVTVVADTLAEADMLASCLFTSGTKDLAKYKHTQYFVVDTNLHTYPSTNFV